MHTNRFIRVLSTFYKNENQPYFSTSPTSDCQPFMPSRPRAQKERSAGCANVLQCTLVKVSITSRTPLVLLTHPWPSQTTESNILYQSQKLGFQCNIPKNPRNSLQHKNCSRTLTKVITRRSILQFIKVKRNRV